MKDSQKQKKKPRKFKFNKTKQTSDTIQKPTETKSPPDISKKNILYNRSFIKNLVLKSKKQEQPLVPPPQGEGRGEGNWQNFQNKFKHYENDLSLILIPIILIIILSTINLMKKQVIQQIAQNSLSSLNFQVTVHPYPVLNSPVNPDISAQAAIVMDADSQVILYAKNPTVRFSMASTTKIMSALVGLDHYHSNSVLTVKTPHVEGSNLEFYYGEQFYFQDLLYAMMLPSSNEAAYAVAENYPGGKDAFIQKMNEKAQFMHLKDTEYGDPAGLNDDQNFSTVVDMARLSSLAIQNQTLAHIVDTKQQTITDLNGRQFILNNLNQLLGIDGINGVKTGTTEAAGEVLVTSTVHNGHTLIIVVMRSDRRFVDTLNLVSLVNNNVQYIEPRHVNNN